MSALGFDIAWPVGLKGKQGENGSRLLPQVHPPLAAHGVKGCRSKRTSTPSGCHDCNLAADRYSALATPLTGARIPSRQEPLAWSLEPNFRAALPGNFSKLEKHRFSRQVAASDSEPTMNKWINREPSAKQSAKGASTLSERLVADNKQRLVLATSWKPAVSNIFKPEPLSPSTVGN